MRFLSTWVAKAVIALVLIVLVLGVLQIRSCSQARQQAAQSKVDRAQDAATVGSAQDAIGTQGNVAASAAESEQTTARNREEIRNAQGADQPVDPAVRDAGFASLCKRPSFRNSPAGRVRCPPTP